MPVDPSSSGALADSFESTVLPHAERLFRLAMWLSRDRTEAEEVVQETLFQALASYHRFTPGTNIRAWLFAILRHVRSKRRRAAWRTDALDDQHLAHEAAPEVMPDRLTDDEVLSALSALPEGFQEVVILCDVEELTYKETADALGVPLGTVMSRLHRARKLLRVTLASYSSEYGIGPHSPGARGKQP